MGEGKQLTMEKRMYEKDIMRKALLNDLDTKFRGIEYCQRVIESNWQSYGSMKDSYKKVGKLLADSKFYYLSATFVLMKEIPEFSKLRLDEHMQANRPPDYNAITPRSPFLTYDLLKQTKAELVGSIKPYRKYITPKFMEYLGECAGKFNDAMHEIDKNIIPHVI